MIDNIYESIKNNIDIYELLYIFLVTIFTIILILTIIWHNNYKIAINKNTCNNKNISSKDLKVLVKSKDIDDDKKIRNLYSIEYKNYKKDSKEPYIKCECPKGDTINKFTEIPIYHNSKTHKKELVCNCDSNYHNSKDSLYYYGNNGLKRYMKNQEATKIFEFDD